MKNFLSIAALITVISCSYQDQKVKLDFTLDETKSNALQMATIEVKVFDDRPNKKIIGLKRFSDKKINITPRQDLALFLQKKISKNLLQKGFRNGKDKIIEVRIESFEYKAVRHFFIGDSEARGAIKIIVKNNKTGEKFIRNFALSAKNKHFIAPLNSTDKTIINAFLQEILQDILNDEAFLRNLML
jgi:uncharacterized lipoprotein YajG